MSIWLVTYSNGIEDKVIEFDAPTEDHLIFSVDSIIPAGYFRVSHKKKRGGYRPGAGGQGGSPSRYQTKTKVVRVPEKIADLIPDLIDSLEGLQNTVDFYSEQVQQSSLNSSNGQPSDRYKKVQQLIQQLEQDMKSVRKINKLLE